MRVNQFGLAALFVAASVGVAIGAAPIAVADICDPIATICQGPDLSEGSDSSLGPEPDVVTGGAPGEMQLTEENPGIASPSYVGGAVGHR
jgi:hypothetical protein